MSTTHRGSQVITLLVTCLGLFMVFLDGSIVNVALPTIQADLAADDSGRPPREPVGPAVGR